MQAPWQFGLDYLEVVDSFCYSGDMLSAASGCELSTTTCVKTAWKKFRELLPVLFFRHLSFKICGCMYSSCVRNAMLHSSETWPLTKPNLQHLQRNDRASGRSAGQLSDRSAMSSSKTVSPLDPMSYLHGLALRNWTSF